MCYRLFSLLMLAVIALGISGCGGEGTSADPLGTDVMMFGHKTDAAGTEWSTAMDVAPRGTVVLTAKVTSASGKPAIAREVNYWFVSNESGATLNATKTYTDATGMVPIIYTAGMKAGFDVVCARLSGDNGSTLITNITVGGRASGRQISLTGAPMSLTAGQNSILTATLTDSSGAPWQGQVITFAIVNISTAILSPLNGGLTDANGRAIAVYTAVAASSDYEDIVEARMADASNAIVIKIAGAVTTTYGISVVALPSSITAMGGQSVVQATVQKVELNSTGIAVFTPISGVTVNFIRVPGGTASGSVSPGSATTDGNGNAVTTYRGGSVTGGILYSDVVQASFTIGGITYTNAIVILYAPPAP